MKTDSMLRLLLVCVCCASAVSGPALAQEPAGTNAAASATTDKKAETKVLQLADLSMTLPADWTEVSQTDTLLTSHSPQESPSDPFLENLRLKTYPLARSTSLEHILQVQKTDALKQFTISGSGDFNSPGGRMVWLAIAPTTPANSSDELTKVDFMAERGDKLFVLHFMTASASYERNLPKFRAIAESVRFTKPYTPPPATNAVDEPEPEVSEARKQGRKIGQYLMYGFAIFAAYVILRRLMGGYGD